MPDTVLNFYKKKHAGYSDQLKKIKRRQRIFVFLRLAMFFMMIFLPLVFFSENLLLAIVIFILLLTSFLILVKRHTAIEKQGRYISCLIQINLQEIEAVRGNLRSFDEGRDYVDPHHQYSYDLDIFGPDSLFHHMNRCCTLSGKDILATMLLKPAGGISEITRRQKTFMELSGKPGFCQHFLATGRVYKEEWGDHVSILKYINSPSGFTRNYPLVLASKLLPVLTLGMLVFMIAGIVPLYGFLLFFFSQLIITGAMFKSVNEKHQLVTRKLTTLRKYSELLKIIQDTSFDAPLLKSLQRHLKKEGQQPTVIIEKLARIVDAFDSRLNFIANILLNGLFLWDINCILLLERWNRRYRKKMPLWLDTVARMDAYISFSVFTFNNPDFVFPKPVTDGTVIYARGLGHPLIPRKERVCNDLSIDGTGRFIIITGANMAGKSTFLRTAGVALVLAMSGSPVCAGEFGFRITEVYTSMRTSDSLSRNESYFYAELKRLKNIIDIIAGGKEVFIILDEMLKGTNTVDKQKGSAALLEKFLSMGTTGIVATHDLTLASLEKHFPSRIENKCFEVEINGDEIHFDYLLRSGVTRKMNALVMMKKMGLLMDGEMQKQQGPE